MFRQNQQNQQMFTTDISLQKYHQSTDKQSDNTKLMARKTSEKMTNSQISSYTNVR